jgi:hydrogenase maturation protein HypF
VPDEVDAPSNVERRPPARARLAVRVEGVVQGVGFRPYVHGLAVSLGLSGLVGNDAAGVFIEVEGQEEVAGRFLRELEAHPPPLAIVERVSVARMDLAGGRGFRIVASDASGERSALISPDTATCEECLRELFDPSDRRYRYGFVNCTNCGPRFTIVRGVPYDRAETTMAGFAMCAACTREYQDPENRRFHAEATCCPTCGPSLYLVGPDGSALGRGDQVEVAASVLRDGRVLAVKGLGGYHLAALASSGVATEALRSRKHREDKPFAVMVADVAAARELCAIGPEEEALLASPRRPVVLLEKKRGAVVAPAVAPGNRHLGLMLPYTPLHYLLAREVGEPFVLTSGNISDEPIAYLDDDARRRLSGLADAFLAHDRPVHTRTDDSVVRAFRGRELLLRRSRGFVPQPVLLARALPRPVLACGAELKNTFCVAKGRRAFVSHHIGDLENYETLRSYEEGISHLERLVGVRPQVVAHDLHPEYLSTKFAMELAAASGLELVGVQHHHAHIASCLADNGVPGPVVGVAFDGSGLGTDATLWGGEFLIADLASFERVGSLVPVPMPGGAAAIREPWRMAAVYLDLAFGGDVPPRLVVAQDNADRWEKVVSLAKSGTNSPLTSSAGRLFDAVSAVVSRRYRANYEGQAAVELEQLADLSERGAYPCVLEKGLAVGVAQLGAAQLGAAQSAGRGPFRLPGVELMRAAVDDLLAGVPPAVISARFHNGLARAVVAGCELVRDSCGLEVVALSGGVFQNVLLSGRVLDGLEEAGFRTLFHSRVPPNDGGISLGQAVVAGAREPASSSASRGGAGATGGLPR